MKNVKSDIKENMKRFLLCHLTEKTLTDYNLQAKQAGFLKSKLIQLIISK